MHVHAHRLPLVVVVLAYNLGQLVACTGGPERAPNQAPAPAPTQPASEPGAAQPAAEQPTEEPAPPPLAAGVDTASVDPNVKPGDQFDDYANGNWRKTATIPEDRPVAGPFLDVLEKAEKRSADLVREITASEPRPGTNEQRIADYYAAFMDEAAIEQRGLEPLRTQLARIAALGTRADLARVLGGELRADVDPLNMTKLHTERLFGIFVTQHLTDPARHVAYLLQGGLGLPDRDYYLSSSKDMVSARAKYTTYVTDLLTQAGLPNPAVKAKAVVALETKLAKSHASVLESEDVHKANNPWSLASFGSEAPGLDWGVFLEAAGLAQQTQIIVWQPAAIRGAAKLVGSEPLDTWQSWLTFHTLNLNADRLPKAIADKRFELYQHELQGTPKQRSRDKRALAALNGDLPDALGRLYVTKYFPPSSKAQVTTLVDNLISAFRDRIDALTWMTAATKEKAKAKVATLKVGVGYPETIRDYASLEIRKDDPVGNHQRAVLFETRHQLAKLGKPVNRAEWWIAPQVVNAVNLPLQNALNFPAAILEPPFFDPKADPAANYGAIGAVIGHEISHSFDNMGAEFDAQGRLANWWTPEDAAHFKAAGERLVAQYNAYEALPGLHINGQQTLGENIADLSGLSSAHAAYQKSLGGQPAPVIDGLSGDQRFFLAYAQLWRQKAREAFVRQVVVTDGHALGPFRALTVRNVDAWYAAFPSVPGEKLHLPPEQRVRIW
ncbi:MAG: M13 family metallopeptidase [Polyangiales bacterium]